MPVSGKTAAPSEIPYLIDADIPDMGAGDKAQAERVSAILEASNRQPLSWLKSGAKKQIIVCDASGVPRYVTLGGDATIDEGGQLQLGPDVVGAAEIAAGAVGAPELAPGAAEESKIKDSAISAAKLASALKGGVENSKVRLSGPAVEVVRSSNQSIPTKVWTSISFEEERFDTDGAWASGSKLVAPVAGLYYAAGTFGFAGNATGIRIARIVKGVKGSSEPSESLAELLVPGLAAIEPAFAGNAMNLASRPFYLGVEDWISLDAYQSTGAGLNVMGDAVHKTEFGMMWQRPL